MESEAEGYGLSDFGYIGGYTDLSEFRARSRPRSMGRGP
jgi:hypothetical protein